MKQTNDNKKKVHYDFSRFEKIIMYFLRLSLEFLGLALQRHRRAIQMLQWVIVGFYLLLLIIPAMSPLPPRGAQIFNNLTLFAQFMFWGIWWPFVILSMLLLGRTWCGIFCPEGALSEWTSAKLGRNRRLPRWLKWRGWPAVAFILTTLYGQLVSVYDYAYPTLIILGGSTIAAIGIGLLYGRGTRVWCRYLCPVAGGFNLLSRLSPISFKSNEAAWRDFKGERPENPQCPPMINIRQLHGQSACHMCGRCAGYRGAIQLQPRPFSEEVVVYGADKQNIWEIRLLLYGMIGVAIGAFGWSSSTSLVLFKQKLAAWLVGQGLIFPLEPTAPWWILTNYPQISDSFNWLDGFCISVYILGSGLLFGGFLSLILSLIRRAAQQNLEQFPKSVKRFSDKNCGKNTELERLTEPREVKTALAFKFHLAQAYLPLAAAGLFLGLSATTVKLLRYDGVKIAFVGEMRIFILSGAAFWSLYLAHRILKRYSLSIHINVAAQFCFSLSIIPIITAWIFIFWG